MRPAEGHSAQCGPHLLAHRSESTEQCRIPAAWKACFSKAPVYSLDNSPTDAKARKASAEIPRGASKQFHSR